MSKPAVHSVTAAVSHRMRASSEPRIAIHAAAPIPVPVKEQMIEWWGPVLHEYYAGTEGNGFTAINSEEWLAHKGSVGRPLLGEAHIVDDDGAELPAGEMGTIYFAGGATFDRTVYQNSVLTDGSIASNADVRELFAAQGTKNAFDGSFHLVGDTANGGLEAWVPGHPIMENVNVAERPDNVETVSRLSRQLAAGWRAVSAFCRGRKACCGACSSCS